MKTIGLIGGTGWVSTVDYYRLLNELTHEALGGSHAARILLYSVNFHDIRQLLNANDWESIARIYIDIATRLKLAGAECLALAANTPHLIAPQIQKEVSLPLIHIAEATAEVIRAQKISRVALLGTKFTMENPFFRDKLWEAGIETMIPEESDRAVIHHSILDEMTKGVFTAATKKFYADLIDRLVAGGAQGIVYACTEIPILLKDEKIKVMSFDTTLIHAKAVVDFALRD